MFIEKYNHFTHSSGNGEFCGYLQCKIVDVKGDRVLDDKSISKNFSLADAADIHREIMGATIDGACHMRASKCIYRCG